MASLTQYEFEQAPGNGEGQRAWRAAVHGVAESQTRISDQTTAWSVYSEGNQRKRYFGFRGFSHMLSL